VHCAVLTDLHKLKPPQNFMICDAGAGAVVRLELSTPKSSAQCKLISLQNLTTYKVIGQMSNLEIAEMCTHSGANCGSLFLDLRFRELARALLADHPAHLDAASLAYFMHSFSETDKLGYMGEADDGELPPFQPTNMCLFNGSQIKCSTLRALASRIPMILPSDLSTESLPSPEISYAGRCLNQSSTRFARPLASATAHFNLDAIITGY
jgi:hypothetical protein